MCNLLTARQGRCCHHILQVKHHGTRAAGKYGARDAKPGLFFSAGYHTGEQRHVPKLRQKNLKTSFSLKSSVNYSIGPLLQAENMNNADHRGGEFQASPQILDVAVPKAEENVTMVCHHKT